MEHIAAAMRSNETIEGLTEARRKSIRHSIFGMPKTLPPAATPEEMHFLQMQIEQFERVHGGIVLPEKSHSRPTTSHGRPRTSSEEDWKTTHNRIHKTSGNPLLRLFHRVAHYKRRRRETHIHAEWRDERRDEYLRPVDLVYW